MVQAFLNAGSVVDDRARKVSKPQHKALLASPPAAPAEMLAANPLPLRLAVARLLAQQARQAGLADEAMRTGTRIRVGEVGEGVYVRFERCRIGCNDHYIRFATGVEKVELKKIAAETWTVVPEMLSTEEAQPTQPLLEPGTDAAVVPEGIPAKLADAGPSALLPWLAAIQLQEYAEKLTSAGYKNLDFLATAEQSDVEELAETIGMPKPHLRVFVKAWQQLNAQTIAAETAPVPLAQRTFGTSIFKPVYENTPVPTGPLQFGGAVQNLLRAYCKAEGLDWASDGQRYFGQLEAEAMQNPGELSDKDLIPVAAQRMWTSALQLAGREFCFIINYAGRQDTPEFVEPLAVLARAINKNCVTERGPAASVSVPKHPDDDVCFRGGGFLDDHRSFFTPGKAFRQPAFLATSFSPAVAHSFIAMRGGDDCVLWTIRIDSARKCKHVNLVTKTNVPGEQEYLFAPYSAFTVLSVSWNAGTVAEPHQIELLAAVDNKDEPEDLPLAPWS